ncbi:SIR2 family protein [Methylomonas sp. MV1]|uniref:SIR2 family protein n=1 Tax=Methylomonas sp. MV1 TaxID=3073620 RepID=UPI0028A31771|nr:SIR2 family protein [Methylomonas sp. MV1]MDT4330737.1 SIR2 family protein [Methylomonas sp. MV1]
MTELTTESTFDPKKHLINFIKTRDDAEIVAFEISENKKFKLSQDTKCSWINEGQEFTERELRPRIEPWLTSLFQSEHLSLFAGSGLTHAVHYLAAGTGAAGMGTTTFSELASEISAASKASAACTNRAEGNIEDQIRVANELLRGLEILKDPRADKLRTDISDVLEVFSQSILTSESGIATAAEDTREKAFNTLINFLMSFASRTGTRDRLNIFTTNYDRLIEAGAELAGLHLLDRFLGNLMPIFRSSRLDLDMHYNPPGIRGEPRYLEGVARFTKLHGSVDWVQIDRDIRRVGLPFGAESVAPYLKAPVLKDATAHQLMIYPNSAKDRETAAYPYVELFRDFAAATCRPNSTLVTYGYSFGDEHINRIIEDMLTIPSTHLVIISYDDPLERIIKTYEKIGRPSQVTLLVGNHLGDLKTLTEHYLPKSAIDKATFRMSELLKQRFGTQNTETPVTNPAPSTKVDETLDDLI